MVAGTADRDEPPAVRASRRRMDEQPRPSRQMEGDDDEALSVDAKLMLLRRLYGARIEAVRRDMPANERAAAIRALRLDLKAAILAITECKRQKQATRWAGRRRWTRPLAADESTPSKPSLML